MLDTKGLEGAVRRGGSAGAEWGAALPVTAAPRGEPGLRAGESGGAGGSTQGCVDMDRVRDLPRGVWIWTGLGAGGCGGEI